MDQSQNTALSFGCSQCLRRFATKSQVASHCLNAHYLKNALAASASEVNAQCLVLPFRKVQTGRLNKWNCQSCGKVLASEDAFESHSRRAHDFGCSHCLQHFVVKSDLVLHLLEHLPTRRFCEQFAESRDVCAIESRPSFGCCECFIHFDSKQGLISHLWKKHNRTFSLSTKFVHCKYCCKSFASVWYLNQHMVKHSTERPFKCKWCNKTYRFRSNLYQHNCPLRKESAVKGAWQLNLQPGFKRFKCSVCPFRCALKAALQRHKMIHKRSVKSFPEVKSSVSLACSYCPERFALLDDKYLHESCIHGQVSLVQCNFCEMEFMDEQTRDDHAQKCHLEAAAQCSSSSSSSGTGARSANDQLLRSALGCGIPLHASDKPVAAAKSSRASRKVRRFDCPFCDMPWLSAAARWDHVRTAHLGDKPTLSGTGVGMNFTYTSTTGSVAERLLPCPACVETFRTSNQLLVHMRTAHGRAYDCDYCFMSFLSDDELTAHTRKKHLAKPGAEIGGEGMLKNERRFSCKFCSQRFLTEGSRSQHERSTHTELPMHHECASCAEAFVTSNQLLVHMRTAHGQAFDCTYCFQSFISSAELSLHLSRKHLARRAIVQRDPSNFPYKCSVCPQQFSFSRQLKQHWRYKHEPKFACPECAKLFVRKSERADHMARVHGELPSGARRNSPPQSHVIASPSNDLAGRQQLSPAVQDSTATDSVSLQNSHTCSNCAFQFQYPFQLKMHWNFTHEPYACAHCNEMFAGKFKLLLHREKAHPPEDTHSHSVASTQKSNGFPESHVPASPGNVSKVTPKKPSPSVQGSSDSLSSNDGLACGKCGLWFQYPSQLRSHWAFTHEPYACGLCDETFTGKSNMLYHRRRVHPVEDTHSVASTKDSNGFSESHVTAFPSNNFLQDHAKLYPFACVFCEQRFVDAVAADAHISEHDSQHACKNCEKMFDSPADLTGHACGAPHPMGLEKLKRWRVSLRCCHCGAAFKDWHRKKHHMIAHHSDKKIKCDFCDRSFWSKNLRRAHMRLVHPDLLSDKARTFFACEYCPRRFCAADVKRLHVRRLHVELSLTPHKCERCGAVFGNTISLRAHVQDCKKLPLRAHSASAFDKPGRIDDVIDAVRAIVGSTPDAVEGGSDSTGPSAMHQTDDVIIDGVVYDVCSPEAVGAASDDSPYASNAPTSSSSLGQISADQFQFDQVAGAFSLQPSWFQCEFCTKLFCIDANSFQSHVTNCRRNYGAMLVSAPFLPLPALQQMPCFNASTNIPNAACRDQPPGSAEVSGLSIDYAAFPNAPPDGSGCFDMPYQTSIIMPCGLCPASFPAFDLLKLHEASEHRCFECPQMFANGFQRNEHYRLSHVAGASGHVTSTALTFSALQSTSSHLQNEQSANQIGHVGQIAPQGYHGNDDDMTEAGMPSNSAHCSNGFGLLMPTASAVADSQPRQVQNTPSANPTGRATQSSTNQISHMAQNTSRNHGNSPVGQAESSNDSAQSNCAIMSASGPIINAKIISIQRPKKRSLPPHSQADNVSQASFSFTSTNQASHVTETASPTTSGAALVFKCDFCGDAAPFGSVEAKLYHENEHHRCQFCRATFPGRVSKFVHMTVVHSAQVPGDLPKASSGANAILTSLQKLVHVPTRGRPKKSRGNDVTPVVDLTQDSDEEEEKVQTGQN